MAIYFYYTDLHSNSGKNIECWHGEANDRLMKLKNQLCWISGTESKVNGNMETHSYYQWIPYYLLLLAFLFWIPKLIWDKFEDGKMKSITEGVTSSGASDDKIEAIGESIKTYINSENAGHMRYGFGYLLTCVSISKIQPILNCVDFNLKFLFSCRF